MAHYWFSLQLLWRGDENIHLHVGLIFPTHYSSNTALPHIFNSHSSHWFLLVPLPPCTGQTCQRVSYLREHYGASFPNSIPALGLPWFLLTLTPHSACSASPSPAGILSPIHLLLSASPENWNRMRYMDALGLYTVSNKTYLL